MIKTHVIKDESLNYFTNPGGKSFTDKSKFRPDSVSLRDKAIALNKTGGGMVGLYDDSELDNTTAKALAWARKPGKDITEIEYAKNVIENDIKSKAETDKANIEEANSRKKISDSLEKIASNTEKGEAEENK